MVQLLSDRKRKKLKKGRNSIMFVPNYFENPLETPAMGDGPFASLGEQPANEDIFSENEYDINGNVIDIHSLYIESELNKAIECLMNEHKDVDKVIFNPGKAHLKIFESYKKYYGNYIVLAEK
jgi:hypothetical protein